MNDRHDGFTWKDAIRIPLVEQLGNGLTPFSTGGQPAQLLAMMQAGVDAGQASSVLLMKFVVFQSMIVINFIISLLVGFHYIAAKMHVLSLLVLFGFLVHLSVIIGLLLVMYWYNFTKKAANIVIRPAHWFMKPDKYEKMQATLNEKIDTFYQESLKIKSEYGKMAKVSLITLLQLGFLLSDSLFHHAVAGHRWLERADGSQSKRFDLYGNSRCFRFLVGQGEQNTAFRCCSQALLPQEANWCWRCCSGGF